MDWYHPDVNRERERNELKKWSIKTMRKKTFDFDAVVTEREQHEIDPLRSDLDSPIVRFFGDALVLLKNFCTRSSSKIGCLH